MIVEFSALHIIDTKGNALITFGVLSFSLSLYSCNLGSLTAFTLEADYRMFPPKKKLLPTE
jgi:hypothetical protein